MPSIKPLHEIPPEIENAAQSGELVVFVGAGISRLIDCPSWDGFADKVLQQLVPKGIDHYELSQINNIKDPKKKLSIAKIIARNKEIIIDYGPIFRVETKPDNVYSYLNSFNSAFVTTNYEKYLQPESRKASPEKHWRFFKREHLLGANLEENGNVIHLHGCLDDHETMVITTRDYLDHYASPEVQDFLKYLFAKKTILFLGYGLDEIEVLEYIHRRGGVAEKKEGERYRRYILQGFFESEEPLFNMLHDYYKESFGSILMGFSRNQKDYSQVVEIIASWADKLKFGKVSLADEVAALEDEING